jgi:CDP-diacylglycerol--serine O-phosphatidyltransferase
MKPPIDPNDNPRAVYVLPNLMTAGNLFCGFMAILQIFEGTMTRRYGDGSWWEHYELSLLFIIGAFAFDILDGRLARLGGQESPFGREFDSLADIISFGVAPALLLFEIVLHELPTAWAGSSPFSIWPAGLCASPALIPSNPSG